MRLFSIVLIITAFSSVANASAIGCNTARLQRAQLAKEISANSDNPQKVNSYAAQWFALRNYELQCVCGDVNGWNQIREGLVEVRPDLPTNCRP